MNNFFNLNALMDEYDAMVKKSTMKKTYYQCDICHKLKPVDEMLSRECRECYEAACDPDKPDPEKEDL